MKKSRKPIQPKSLKRAWRLHRPGATIYGETRIGTLRAENGTIRILPPNGALVVSFDSTFSGNYKEHFFCRLRDAKDLIAIF